MLQYTQFQYAYDAYWVSPDGQIQPRGSRRTGQPHQGPGSLYGHLPQGLHSARRHRLEEQETTTTRFVAQTVVMTLNETLSIPNMIKTTRPDDYRRNTATIEWPNDAYGGPLAIYGSLYRGAVFQSGKVGSAGQRFRPFLVEDGWLAHYLDFAGDRLLPPMAKLLEQPFWLDPSDPHRMASAIQTLTRPQHYDVGAAADMVFSDEPGGRPSIALLPRAVTPEQAVDEAIARIKQLVQE